MRVIVGQGVYDMSNRDADKLLEIASGYVSNGIYGIEKDGILELRNDIYIDEGTMREAISEYKALGFKVYASILGSE